MVGAYARAVLLSAPETGQKRLPVFQKSCASCHVSDVTKGFLEAPSQLDRRSHVLRLCTLVPYERSSCTACFMFDGGALQIPGPTTEYSLACCKPTPGLCAAHGLAGVCAASRLPAICPLSGFPPFKQCAPSSLVSLLLQVLSLPKELAVTMCLRLLRTAKGVRRSLSKLSQSSTACIHPQARTGLLVQLRPLPLQSYMEYASYSSERSQSLPCRLTICDFMQHARASRSNATLRFRIVPLMRSP